jgi:hypothetical protein
MSAPKNNDNAAKPAADQLTSVIYVRMTARQKAACVRAARGRRLSQWAAEHLIRASAPAPAA